MRPETVLRWLRAGFRRYWHWKSRRRGGRPQVRAELRALIRQMSVENPLWGAPRIHGELLKLGFEVSQSSVAKYMVRRRGPPIQGWRAFLANMPPISPRWICSLSQPSASTCSMPSSLSDSILSDSIAELLSGSASPDIRQRNGLRVRSRANLSPGMRLLHAIPSAIGMRLWRRRHTSIARHGDTGQADCARLALAERLCRTVDRVDPSRVFGPYSCLRRGASASHSAILCSLLQ